MPQGALSFRPSTYICIQAGKKGQLFFKNQKIFLCIKRMEKMKMKCCICGKSFYGNGNNAYPLMKNRENKCCNECNNDYIIPLRMIEILAKKERNKTDVPN